MLNTSPFLRNNRLATATRTAVLALSFVFVTGNAIAGEGTSGAGTSGAGTSIAGTGTGTGTGAGTSAAVAPPAAAVIPAVAPPAATPDPTASAATDDGNGKPSAADILAGNKGGLKKKVARIHRKAKAETAAAVPDNAQPASSQSLLEALFGNSQAQQPASEAAATDPTTTGATDPVSADAALLPKGKHGKGAKLAKNSDGSGHPEPAASTANSIFGNDDTPWASGELGHPLLSPGNVDPLKTAIKRYEAIVASGGWPTVPPLQMEVGTNNEAVTLLRQRLAAEGDLTAQPSGFAGPNYFDQDVGAALKNFQDRYGLNATGDLMDTDRLKNGTRTVAALNVAADARLAQLKANLKRLQQQVIAKGRYVVVNIPGEQIEAVDDNTVALRLNGVVGKPERPSPLLSSNIEEVKFNPIWTLPPTVVKEDLIPKGQSLQQKGVDVLAKFGIDAYDGNGKKLDTSKLNWSSQTTANLRFSEQPGKDNPLGFAKLDFASPESVYMHDTPSSKLFDKSYRAASSGCIRVDHMDRLVTWLLKDTDGWSASRVLGMKASGESKIVRIKHAVPLHWVYITAWATEDGVVHFRRDLYGKDQAFGVSQTASAY